MVEIKIEKARIEQAPSQESGFERVVERPVSAVEQTQYEYLAPSLPVTSSIPVATPNHQPYKDPRLIEIEQILEEDLAEYYFQLPDESKIVFKETGEQTAKKINALLGETKVAVQKIVDLIRAWLGLLPGVNRFFVEQEAKIKADKIMLNRI